MHLSTVPNANLVINVRLNIHYSAICSSHVCTDLRERGGKGSSERGGLNFELERGG